MARDGTVRSETVQVKICGLSTPDMVAGARRAGADAVGFVFVAKSPRHVAPAAAAALAEAAADVLRAGVFVDPDDALLEAAIEGGRLDIVQLQGGETPERVAEVRARYGVAVWRAIGVATRADIAAAVQRFPMADALLFDARPPKGAALEGGNGAAFDWTILRDTHIPMPWVLAGGLDAGNVARAVRATGARFVDVSSGVETAPGKKSLEKVTDFIKAARLAPSDGPIPIHGPAF